MDEPARTDPPRIELSLGASTAFKRSFSQFGLNSSDSLDDMSGHGDGTEGNGNKRPRSSSGTAQVERVDQAASSSIFTHQTMSLDHSSGSGDVRSMASSSPPSPQASRSSIMHEGAPPIHSDFQYQVPAAGPSLSITTRLASASPPSRTQRLGTLMHSEAPPIVQQSQSPPHPSVASPPTLPVEIPRSSFVSSFDSGRFSRIQPSIDNGGASSSHGAGSSSLINGLAQEDRWTHRERIDLALEQIRDFQGSLDAIRGVSSPSPIQSFEERVVYEPPSFRQHFVSGEPTYMCSIASDLT